MEENNKEQTMILKIDYKRAQREQNYRRAEAFLIWKFGPMWDDARRFLRGSGMDWPSLFVEFVDKVEEDLLARTATIEKLRWDAENLKASAFACPTSWPADTFGDFMKSPLSPIPASPRQPFRKHWKDDPTAYSPEELKKLRDEDKKQQ